MALHRSTIPRCGGVEPFAGKRPRSRVAMAPAVLERLAAILTVNAPYTLSVGAQQMRSFEVGKNQAEHYSNWAFPRSPFPAKLVEQPRSRHLTGCNAFVGDLLRRVRTQECFLRELKTGLSFRILRRKLCRHSQCLAPACFGFPGRD